MKRCQQASVCSPPPTEQQRSKMLGSVAVQGGGDPEAQRRPGTARNAGEGAVRRRLCTRQPLWGCPAEAGVETTLRRGQKGQPTADKPQSCW